jgi:hypothetical protein
MMRNRLGWGVAVVAAGSLAALMLRSSDTWAEGSVHGPWRTVYTGFGSVSGSADSVELTPRAADGPATTHAALVVSGQSYGDLALTLRTTTRRQLRTPVPHTWEAGWVIWHYQGPDRFYALVLKPNGWELSKQDPRFDRGQRFLASGSRPSFAIGTTHTVGVSQVGDKLKVSADGSLLADLTDTDAPYLRGAIGLYSEDADVVFDHIDPVQIGASP